MSRRFFRIMVFGSGILFIALLALAPSALADFQGSYELQNWSSTVILGPLDVAINPATGPSPFAEFSYEAPKPYNCVGST